MEAQYHINYVEMLAIYLALQTFAKGWANTHIRVMCVNTTAVNVINHMGTSHSDSCNSLAKEIWEWCIARDIWVSIAHIPGKQNLVADFESRRNQREAEWRLGKAALQNALSRLNFQPDIDLSASRINYLFSEVCFLQTRPKSVRHRCIFLTIVLAGFLRISTFQCNSRSFEQNTERKL